MSKNCTKKANKVWKRTGSVAKAQAALKRCLGVRSFGRVTRRRRRRR